ncbi:ABC transporter permease [Spiroplasma endosymbiont of Polydrusus pterygomalis]|uniref:ABC transporter permease n=1 Tax=Spiroplasma endosymbiont of Polydrusus pterygomalis TaxID=3139327 RepID=UPI003CCB3371
MKNKNKSWIKLFQLILFKINHSFITIFLLIFSLTFSLITSLILFSLNLANDIFFVDFQYYFIIFYNILLFIFVVMNAIKIFGIQIEDSSFLLLITKPYSRKNIILTQYIALFFTNFIFILFNFLILLIIAGTLGFMFNEQYLIFHVITILKFFVFCFLFSILLTIGVVVLSVFIRSQTVFLIFIIFCSLFLLGGLPYSFNKIKTDNIILSFKNNESYSVRQIKNSILFKENLKNNLIKYHNLTKTIFNFYSGLTSFELKNINSENVINKRINFFRSLGLIYQDSVVKKFEGKVAAWRPVEYINKTIILQITFNSYFKDLDFLKLNLNGNKIFQDLLNLINDYNLECNNINTFMLNQKTKATTLVTSDNDINKTFIAIKGEDNTTKAITDDEIKNIFLSNYEYQFDFRNQFNKIFYNPIYYVIRTVEDYIYEQVRIDNNIINNDIIINNNYKKYIDSVNTYQILNYINIIEHWNQIWTYFMGYYGDFWFEIYPLSNIDFDTQKNALFSYHDFKLTFIKSKINIEKIQYFQNISIIIYGYIIISVILFYISYVTFLKKKIS